MIPKQRHRAALFHVSAAVSEETGLLPTPIKTLSEGSVKKRKPPVGAATRA